MKQNKEKMGLGPECDENPMAMKNFGTWLFIAIVIISLGIAISNYLKG